MRGQPQPGSRDPRIKNHHWLDMVMALLQAYERGAESALLVSAEGPSFNVFAVVAGTLVAPEDAACCRPWLAAVVEPRRTMRKGRIAPLSVRDRSPVRSGSAARQHQADFDLRRRTITPMPARPRAINA